MTSLNIALFSDLHCETYKKAEIVHSPNADIIVLAGDIDNGVAVIDYAAAVASANNKPVIVIAGNHEYYGYDLPHLQQELWERAKFCKNVYFLEKDEVVIKGVRFLGCTLWSNFTLHEKGKASDSCLAVNDYMLFAEKGVNDFFAISYYGRPLTGKDLIEFNVESRRWLEQALARPFSGKTVVVSHFAPHPACLADRWKGNPTGFKYAPYFINDLSDLILKYQPDYWFYGHTHDNIDVVEGKTQITSNQKGYAGHSLSPGYSAQRLITIE